MSGKIILQIMKIILLKMKTILRIVVLEKGFPARAQEKMFVGRAVNLAGKWSVENKQFCSWFLWPTNFTNMHETFSIVLMAT